MTIDQEKQLFIALQPGEKIRKSVFFFTWISGLALFTVSLCSFFIKEQIVLLQFLAVPVSFYVMWYAFSYYKDPVRKIWPQPDTLRNLTGFMIIAQAAGMFANTPGFQVSHLFMMAGAVIIFLGVMYPAEKNRSGFTVKENKLIVKTKLFSRETEMEVILINSIKLLDNQLTIQQVNGTTTVFDLSGFEQTEIATGKLKELIETLKPKSA